MKNFKRFFVLSLLFSCVFILTACGKSNYDEYIGYQFSGKDPWGNELAITIRTLENDKLTWTFTDVITGEKGITLYNELETEFKDGETSFNVKGEAEDNYTFDYTGTLTLKYGNLLVKFEKGQLTSNSSNGGSSSHQAEALADDNRVIVLTKVVDNA